VYLWAMTVAVEPVVESLYGPLAPHGSAVVRQIESAVSKCRRHSPVHQ
jgi:hypothetical protein